MYSPKIVSEEEVLYTLVKQSINIYMAIASGDDDAENHYLDNKSLVDRKDEIRAQLEEEAYQDAYAEWHHAGYELSLEESAYTPEEHAKLEEEHMKLKPTMNKEKDNG